MTAVAALESGQKPVRQGPNALLVAAYIGGGAILLASVALMAGFYNLRDLAVEWPGHEIDFDEYLSVMLSTTILLSGGVAGWASQAATDGNRRQALAALIITIGLGGAFLNLAWYTGAHSEFGPSSHAFGAIVISALVLGAVAVAIGIGFLALALLRTQLRPQELGQGVVTAAVRFWFFVVAAWMISPVALYGLMSPR